MQQIYAEQVASISELKKNPTKLIESAAGKPVAILNHNTAAAYLIPVDTYKKMLELMDNKLLELEVTKRLVEDYEPIDVDVNDL